MTVDTHVPQTCGMISLHGRLVRKIRIDARMHSEVSINSNCDWFLMVERDGRTWLWDGMLDP